MDRLLCCTALRGLRMACPASLSCHYGARAIQGELCHFYNASQCSCCGLCVLLSGFTEPGAIYRVDMAAERPTPDLFRQTKLKVAHNPADYETRQVGRLHQVGMSHGPC